ncbi:HNH endonuclease signature motif containing protein [Sulfitobacter sp. OXR-159]|uniref:HNH endonuclease signature motif containing protein n=1 Tax=Sulfitobacter sp. OXR-159 TaxID=3100174 RepID=UPI002AC8B840|nr:HNH endonuclease signature motif containing protein [Sulfitobacter sp. OXR-159]WPZ30721.1 HNH endonuclease signature motif containing protein [Sulfitobacter sp. OXR-159]WPZ30822.1 HNH endonuclease signature motif containing protein [Sulfitobacter sp. OXR-159]
MMRTVSPHILRVLLRYEAETGKLYWRERKADLFSGKNPERAKNVWNAHHAGQEAFLIRHKHGYLCGTVFKKRLLAHRVIWALVNGEWPADQIDHINGVRSDNRIVNLRSVSRSENMKNQKRPSDNSSGHTGVYWFAQTSRWTAQITKNRKTICLGYFKDLDQAVAARKKAEQELGFHVNHGRSA